MLKNTGAIPNSFEKIISEIFKTNVKFLAKTAENARKREILICKQEANAILDTYENMLAEATKILVDNLYEIVENMVSEIIPNFQYNHEFISELIKNEIDPITDHILDLDDVEITTGSVRFHDTFVDVFSIVLDYGLDEDMLIFKYKETIKTIDFSTLQTNMIREVLQCRDKHLSMIDAIKMKM